MKRDDMYEVRLSRWGYRPFATYEECVEFAKESFRNDPDLLEYPKIYKLISIVHEDEIIDVNELREE